jgi:hypothetical protein
MITSTYEMQWPLTKMWKIIIIFYLCKIKFFLAIINHSNSFTLSWIPSISASNIYRSEETSFKARYLVCRKKGIEWGVFDVMLIVILKCFGIRGSHGSECVTYGVLGCDGMWTFMWLPTYWRNISPPSSGLNTEDHTVSHPEDHKWLEIFSS